MSVENEDLENSNCSIETVLRDDVECSVVVLIEQMLAWKKRKHRIEARWEELTWNGSFLVGIQDSPEYEDYNEGEGIGREVEDTEPIPVLCVGVLAGRGQELLETSGPGSRLAGVVRIVEVHECPNLPEDQSML